MKAQHVLFGEFPGIWKLFSQERFWLITMKMSELWGHACLCCLTAIIHQYDSGSSHNSWGDTYYIRAGVKGFWGLEGKKFFQKVLAPGNKQAKYNRANKSLQLTRSLFFFWPCNRGASHPCAFRGAGPLPAGHNGSWLPPSGGESPVCPCPHA